MSELLLYSQKDALSLYFYSGDRGLSEEMLAEGVRKIAGAADSDADLDLEQLERDIACKRKLSFAVKLKVQAFLHDRNLSAVFVSNGR